MSSGKDNAESVFDTNRAFIAPTLESNLNNCAFSIPARTSFREEKHTPFKLMKLQVGLFCYYL